MKCEACLWENTLSDIPFCPFCGKALPASATAESALLMAETARMSDSLAETAEAYRTAADKGSISAAFTYAEFAENGVGLRRNVTDAVAYYQMAAKKGHAAAAAALARILLRDYGKEKEYTALFWLLFATAEGNADAPLTLALHFEEEDPLCYLTVAALRGNKKAALLAAKRLSKEAVPDRPLIRGFLNLAEKEALRDPILYMKTVTASPRAPMLPAFDSPSLFCRIGDMAAKEKEDFIAITYYAKAAKAGSGVAAVRLGSFYATGRSVPKSLASAGKWYLQAADDGDTGAMVSLGEMFLAGNGIQRDAKKALTLFCRCASLGDPKAEFSAAELYFEGDEGIQRDVPLAMSLYEKSADKGYAPAMEKRSRIFAAVATVYHRANELFREEKYEDAIKKYLLAAEMGHGGAICNLGYCYQKGLGCKKDLKRAMAFYRRGILEGKPAAKYNMGLCYLRNEGVRFDPKRAEELLYGSGMPDAEKLIAEMRNRGKLKKANVLYSIGCTLQRRGDAALALHALTAAAKEDSKKAMVFIGCHYEFGSVTHVDFEAARRWYQKSGLSFKEIDRLKRGFLRNSVIASNLKIKK